MPRKKIKTQGRRGPKNSHNQDALSVTLDRSAASKVLPIC